MYFGKPSDTDYAIVQDPELRKLDFSDAESGGAVADTRKETSFSDVFFAAEESFKALDAINSRALAGELAVDEHNKKIKEATGIELDNPHRIKIIPRRRTGGRPSVNDPFKEYEDRKREIAERNPQFRDLIKPDQEARATTNLYRREADARLRDSLERYSRQSWYDPDSYVGNVAAFAGGMYGMRKDPINVIASTLGFNKAKIGFVGWLTGVFKNAGVGAAIELAQAPIVQANRAEAGVDYGVSHAAMNAAMAAAFGGIIDGGGRAVSRGVARARGQEAQLDAKGYIESWVPKGQAIDPAVMAKARDGDIEATKEVAKRLGLDEEPIVRGVIARAEDDEAILKAAGVSDLESGAGMQRLSDTFAQAERSILDPEEPPPVRYADDFEVPPARGPDLTDDAPAPGKSLQIDGKPVAYRDVDLKQTATDASLFQFKAGGDAAGATGRLGGVKRWDVMAAGKTVVFQRADGTLVIADGHQRATLAKSLTDQETNAPAFVLKETDGWTPEDVRAIAAKKNLQEGSGSAVDAAKVMRERPDLIDEALPLTTSKMQTARSLTRLSDDAFDAVVGGIIHPRHAGLVADLVPSRGDHASIINELAEMRPATDREARIAIGELLQAGHHEGVQMTLLGAEPERRTLLRERVKVLDEALKELRNDARVFATLQREANKIEGNGNRLNPDANVQRAIEAEQVGAVLERLASQRGAVSDWLSDAARSVADGQPAARAARAFSERVRKALDEDGLSGLTRQEPQARIDDPNGPEADAQIEELQTQLFALQRDAKAITSTADRAMPEIRKELDKIVNRLPKNVRLRLEDKLVFRAGNKTLAADGVFNPEDLLIRVSLASNNPARYARHEEIHAYKQLGLFSGDEWATLTKHAVDNDLRKEFDIDGRYGELYKERFKGNEDLIEAALIEETIADMWAARETGRSYGRTIDRIIDRVMKVLRQVSEMLGRKRITKVEDVFERIESGEIGRRPQTMREDMGARPSDKPITPGLDMSQDARKARAREMGFDTDNVLYHGSPDFREVKKAGGFDARTRSAENMGDPVEVKRIQDELDAERAANGTSNRYFELLNEAAALRQYETIPQATYFTDNKGIAKTYTNEHRAFDFQNAESDLIDVYARGNLLDVSARGKKFSDVSIDAVRSQLPENLRSTFDDIVQRFADPTNTGKIRTGDMEVIASKLGFDGFRLTQVRDAYDGSGPPVTVVAVFDPSNIRSVNAAFDPAHADSSKLMYSISDQKPDEITLADVDRMDHVTEVVEACRR